MGAFTHIDHGKKSCTFSVELELAKNVVYKITCDGCHENYIGQTSRDLHIRIRDHMLGRGSTLHQHLQTCGDGRFNVTILSHEKDPINTQIAEGLLRRKLKPKLNGREALIDALY